jgi:hypothetical protein
LDPISEKHVAQCLGYVALVAKEFAEQVLCHGSDGLGVAIVYIAFREIKGLYLKTKEPAHR